MSNEQKLLFIVDTLIKGHPELYNTWVSNGKCIDSVYNKLNAKAVGTLKCEISIKGYKKAEKGTNVYEKGNVYYLELQSIIDCKSSCISYSKEGSFRRLINFKNGT